MAGHRPRSAAVLFWRWPPQFIINRLVAEVGSEAAAVVPLSAQICRC